MINSRAAHYVDYLAQATKTKPESYKFMSKVCATLVEQNRPEIQFLAIAL